MATQVSAKPGTGFMQVAYPKGHNWTDVGKGVKLCRECGAELKQCKNYALYTPGNGDCDED